VSLPRRRHARGPEVVLGRVSKGTDYEGVRWHPHIARHSYATALLEQGVALGVVQHLLGHAHAETTAVYTRPPPNS